MSMLGLIVGAAFGFGAGFFQSSLQSIGESILEFKWNVIFEYDIIYALFLLISLTLIIRILVGIFPIRSALARVIEPLNEEWIKPIEKKVGMLIIWCSFTNIVTISWLAISMSQMFQLSDGDPNENWVLGILIIGLIFQLIAGTLQFSVFRLYNKVFPNRKFNWFAKNPREEFFQQLDEGEKWVVYSASFKTFKSMEQLMIWAIVFFVIYSLLFSQLMIVPILVLSVIWIAQNVIYYVEVGKYDK
jgi:hypothetical protein